MSFEMVTKTAEEYRKMSGERIKAEHDSFERCDTDGALSQWAHGILSRKYSLMAKVAEDGGRATFPVLTDLDGNIVPSKMIETQHGSVMVTVNGEFKSGQFGQFVSFAKRPQTTIKKGFRLAYGWAPAAVALSDSVTPSPYTVQLEFVTEIAGFEEGHEPEIEAVQS